MNEQRLARRSFLRLTAATGAGFLLNPAGFAPAVEPFERRGPARLRLSLAAYSFRDFFAQAAPKRENPNPAGRNPDLDMKGFIDFCAEHGCDGAELTSYYLPRDISNEALLGLRRHAFLKGVAVSGTAVGNTFTDPPGDKRESQIRHVKLWIDRAAVMGAPHVRVFAGNTNPGTSLKKAKRLCIDALQECADHAAHKGVFLGLENHGGIVAEAGDLLDIIRDVQSPWVGLNLDTGNFHTDDPYRDMEQCAPFAVNVQLKVAIRRRTGPAEPADLKRILNMLRSVHYQGFVALEYESAQDPWIAVPRYLGKLKELI